MFDIKSFHEAKSVEDAINALMKDPDTETISGDIDVLIRIREGKDAGWSVVFIRNVEELRGVRLLKNSGLWIGAGTSFSHVINDPLIQRYIPMPGEAVDMVGSPQIRNTGTIGGNICNGTTSADSVSTIWTLETSVVLEGPDGRRTVPVCKFHTGPGRVIRDWCGIYTCFLIHPEGYAGWTGYYMKYGKRETMEITTLGRAVRVKLLEDKKRTEDVGLGYGVVGPMSLRCRKAEEAPRGCGATDSEAILEFGRDALIEINPCSSWRTSKEFRLQFTEELSKCVLMEAMEIVRGRVSA